jgi:HK97 family phage major capsid protein
MQSNPLSPTMSRHYAAFRAKVLAAHRAGVAYERRNDPEMTRIADLLTKLGTGFDEFREANDATVRDLTSRIESIERKTNRPGNTLTDVATNPTAHIGTVVQRTFIDVTTGRVMPVLGREDGLAGIEAKLRQHYRDTKGADPFDLDPFERPSMADFLRAVAGQKTSVWAQKALSIGTDSAGGHTVPVVLMPGLLDALFAQSSMLAAGSRMIPLEQGGKSYTLAAVNVLPTAAWRNESAAIAESDPTFRAITLTPRSLAFRFKMSRELLADAASLDNSAISRIMAQAFGVALDAVGLRGSGSAPTPRGILNVAGVQSVTNGAAGTSLATIKWGNLLAAYQAITAANAPAPTSAIMHPRTLIGFASLADSTGQPLQRPDLLSPMRFLQSSQVPINLTVGASTDCSEVFIGDFSRCFWGVREAPSLMVDPYSASSTGEVTFICHWRGDFAVEHAAAFAVATGVRP